MNGRAQEATPRSASLPRPRRSAPSNMSIFDPPSPNLNRLWADLIVEELVRCGVDFFCLASGSRSTPLVTAVAAHPRARHVMHYDERGTAFFALGYGRATRRPAAWITTSGTALANGFPAVVEAAADGVPMLLLTADRPPELRHSGANQTIDQVRLFGDYARWFFDLPTPSTDVDPAMVLTTVDQAVYRAVRAPGGPVHLNAMFREPLAPTPDGRDYRVYAAGLAAWQASDEPYTRYAAAAPRVDPSQIEALGEKLRGVERGLLVAGRLHTRAEGEAALRLADRLGWPLLPDVGSQRRLGPCGATGVALYDQILGSEAFGAAHAPEAVLHVGGRPTSKRLAHFLARSRPRPYVVVNETPARLDPDHLVTHRLESDVVACCDALAEAVEAPAAASSWLAAWRDAGAHAGAVLDAFFDEADALSEPLVARLVSRHLPEDHALVTASSMPVRDVDMFGATDGPPARVAANRGASGIDGTVATAAGFSEGSGNPVTLLIGDLALLHDLNALALLRTRPVVAVALNNDGGGIFHFLPIAEHTDVFEPYFGTPHGLTFEAAAALFGLAYHHPTTPEEFLKAYRVACRQATGSIIEVTTERRANHALHRDQLARVAGAVGASPPG